MEVFVITLIVLLICMVIVLKIDTNILRDTIEEMKRDINNKTKLL